MTAVFGHSLVAQVPLLDVGRANGPLREGILAAMERVFDSGRFLYGPDVTQLEQSLVAIVKTPEAAGKYVGLGAVPRTMGTEEFRAHVAAENQRWAGVVKASGAKVD